MFSVIALWIVPAPAAVERQACPGVAKQPANPVNVVLNDPRSTKRYSNFAVQLPPSANSVPKPTVHPIFVTPLPLNPQTEQVLPTAIVHRVGGTLGIPVAEAELSISIRP